MAQLLEHISSIKHDLETELIQSNECFGSIVVKEFVSKNTTNYLIEVPQSLVHKVPRDWECLSA
jgi:hypothetical protein